MEKEKKYSSYTTWQKLKRIVDITIRTILYAVIFVILIIFGFVGFYFVNSLININGEEGKQPLFNAYIIISPSMVPSINVYDAIVVKRVDEQLEKGDIITFSSSDKRYDGITITHRIIGVQKNSDGEVAYKTKGDANNTADTALVTHDDIYGEVVLRVPKIGYIQSFISTSYGWILLILIPSIAIVIYDIIKLIKFIFRKITKKETRNRIDKETKEEDIEIL